MMPPYQAPTIILKKDDLKDHIETMFCCRKCAEREHKQVLKRFLEHIAAELGLQPCQSTNLWLKFVRSDAREGNLYLGNQK